jgi:hypothetical protein
VVAAVDVGDGAGGPAAAVVVVVLVAVGAVLAAAAGVALVALAHDPAGIIVAAAVQPTVQGGQSATLQAALVVVVVLVPGRAALAGGAGVTRFAFADYLAGGIIAGAVRAAAVGHAKLQLRLAARAGIAGMAMTDYVLVHDFAVTVARAVGRGAAQLFLGRTSRQDQRRNQ